MSLKESVHEAFNGARHRILQGLRNSTECKVICGNKIKKKRHHCDIDRECVAKQRNLSVAEGGERGGGS